MHLQMVVDIPPRVQKLEEEGKWPAAAGLLLDGCNRLGRPEMSKVNASLHCSPPESCSRIKGTYPARRQTT